MLSKRKSELLNDDDAAATVCCVCVCVVILSCTDGEPLLLPHPLKCVCLLTDRMSEWAKQQQQQQQHQASSRIAQPITSRCCCCCYCNKLSLCTVTNACWICNNQAHPHPHGHLQFLLPPLSFPRPAPSSKWGRERGQLANNSSMPNKGFVLGWDNRQPPRQ